MNLHGVHGPRQRACLPGLTLFISRRTTYQVDGRGGQNTAQSQMAGKRMVELECVSVADRDKRLIGRRLFYDLRKRDDPFGHYIRSVFQEVDPLSFFPGLEKEHL